MWVAQLEKCSVVGGGYRGRVEAVVLSFFVRYRSIFSSFYQEAGDREEKAEEKGEVAFGDCR